MTGDKIKLGKSGKNGRPARMRDRIETAIRELVAAGQLRRDARDCEAYHAVCHHLEAQGCRSFEIPSLRTWRRHVGALRIMWLTRKAA
jgi:hypothetical protein